MKTKKYYRVGISGHRDLLPSQTQTNLTILKGHLLKLKQEHKEILVLTPLADGADRLIAKAALELDIPYDVILPMPKELYIEDFSDSSKKEFDYYLNQAKDIETIELYAANTIELISKPSAHRNFQYRQVGRKIVDISDEMIIMSDGVQNNKMGGTEDIAKYAHKCGIILYEVRCDRLCA
jgi:hypothetical protein